MMNIPQGYRRLAEGETTQIGDMLQFEGEDMRPVSTTPHTVGTEGWTGNGTNWQVLRKLEEQAQ